MLILLGQSGAIVEVFLPFCTSFPKAIYQVFSACQLGGRQRNVYRAKTCGKYSSPKRFVTGAAKRGEETHAKLCYLSTSFFWIKPNPRNESSLSPPRICCLYRERAHIGRLPIHIVALISGFGGSINFFNIFCSKFPTADGLVFTWFPKPAPSVWFYLGRGQAKLVDHRSQVLYFGYLQVESALWGLVRASVMGLNNGQN